MEARVGARCSVKGESCLEQDGGNIKKGDNHLARFRNFVHFHDYQACDIWEGEVQLSFLDFVSLCSSKLGYRFTPE